MQVKEFVNKCIGLGYDWKEGDHDGKRGYFIGSRKLDTVTHFTPEAVEANNWPTLHKQIVRGKDVSHITRVVGYYSKVENWNKSKTGELKELSNTDIAEEMVNQISASHGFKANAKVIQTYEETIRTLVDMIG